MAEACYSEVGAVKNYYSEVGAVKNYYSEVHVGVVSHAQNLFYF